MTAVACMNLERLRTRRRCMKLLNRKSLPYAANGKPLSGRRWRKQAGGGSAVLPGRSNGLLDSLT